MRKLTGLSVSIDEHEGLFNPTTGCVAVDPERYNEIATSLLRGDFVTYGDRFGLVFVSVDARKRAEHHLPPQPPVFAVIPYMSPEQVRQVQIEFDGTQAPSPEVEPLPSGKIFRKRLGPSL